MKVFISADIEGVNGITCWDETEHGSQRYFEFKEQMLREVNACIEGAIRAGATEIVVKDAHDSARNLDIYGLNPKATLIRGWEGMPCSMMAGLDETFDAVMFVGYHSASRSSGNSLSHTMNSSRIHHIKINDEIASEYTINSLYASYLKVPVVFLSGDLELCNSLNYTITTVASKIGMHGATKSVHPSITVKEIKEKSYASLMQIEKKVFLPKHFKIEIQYKKHLDAYNASFFPNVKLVGSDKIVFESSNYYDCLVVFKYLL